MNSLENWVEQGWLKRHDSSAQEIGEQLAAVDRDLEDANKDLSDAWRCAIADTAALPRLGTIYRQGDGASRDRLQADAETRA